jgi:CDP-paratose 2-epimerase
MKVLVTGGCGFIGSHACEYFRNKDWDVVSYDNMTKYELVRTGYATDACRDYNWNALRDMGVTMVREDIRHLDALIEHSSGCDYIVHTAAQPAVTLSLEDPANDLTNNVVGTFNVLEAARRHGIPVVSCATIHVYGNWVNAELKEAPTRYVRDPVGLDESARTMEGYLTPLHASKASAEHYVRVFADAYGVKAASFRLSGLYGPRQLGGEDHGWVANFSIRNILRRPMTIYGTGKQVRDVLFATDVAEAFYAFFEHQKPGIYNIGGSEANAISLLECIQLIDRTTGCPSDVRYDAARFGDLSYFVCDVSKARRDLGWVPKVKPDEGVPRLIEWVKQNRFLFEGA